MLLRVPLFMALVLLSASSTPAGAVDGSHDLICSAVEATTCTKERGRSRCTTAMATERNVPKFISLRFKERKIELRYSDRKQKTVTFSELQEHELGIAVQGALQDEGAWTIAILKKDGSMEVAGMEPLFNYFLYGECTRLD